MGSTTANSRTAIRMRKWIKIFLIALGVIIITAVSLEYLHIKNVSVKRVFIFPENFKGVVLIIHDQKDGTEIKKKDEKYIYRIPPDGILKVREPLKASVSQNWYYFEDDQGNRTEFTYCFDTKEMKLHENKTYAFGGSVGTYGQGNKEVDCTTFLVGTEKEADSLSKALEKIHPLEILKKTRDKN